MTPRAPIVQHAYHVADLDEAIRRWHRAFGLGPFFVRRHIALEDVRYRGRASTLDISAAYVQAGPVQVELVTQHDDVPSAFRDVFAPGEEGLHHVAVLPDSYEQAIAHWASLGCEIATELRTASGRGAAYVDARAITGHMVEVYRPSEQLAALYRTVADAAARWDGRELVIETDPRG
jgi:hypothetical protein